ncbi:MAG: di-trans,poly-cis-decaprenylcistransferase [Oscillospiraceae bacterium]|nr:di-trans,poly-cis-decaprenylcistransferase [Oscillospiraceae bacterium]
MSLANENTNLKIPTHVAFIMDGNGRWAKKRLMPRNYGHREGAKALKTIIRACNDIGIKYATFYAFSTENWSRPDDEVKGLMDLFDEQLDTLKQYTDENARLIFIGNRAKLSESLQKKMAENEEGSKDNTGLTVLIAVNYGGHDEITRAVKKISVLTKEGYITEDQIAPELVNSFLDTGNIPPVDLLIRTGGEERISNFLIWQCAYAEFYFCDTLWPDFGKNELIEALKNYTSRDRRFGGVMN